MKRRSFHLFELLLAIFLVSCLLFPLLRTHFIIISEERKQIEKIQLDWIQESVFGHIRTLFYENKIPFDEAKEGLEGQLSKAISLSLAAGKEKTFVVKYSVMPLEICRKKSVIETYILLEVRVDFCALNGQKEHSYTKTFLLREHA